jgi:hypothetical protein
MLLVDALRTRLRQQTRAGAGGRVVVALARRMSPLVPISTNGALHMMMVLQLTLLISSHISAKPTSLRLCLLWDLEPFPSLLFFRKNIFVVIKSAFTHGAIIRLRP